MTNVAVDLGGTRLRIAVGEGRGDWRHVLSRERPAPATPAAIVEAVAGALRSWKLGPNDVSAVGVSIAGVVTGGGVVRRGENLGWTDVAIGPAIERAIGLPAAVDTDVFCGALYEAREGAARTAGAALYVALGTGIGHAVVIDGRVWRGATGAANAFGHVVVEPDGPRCYCGGRGCLCLYVGGRAEVTPEAAGQALATLGLVIANATTLLEPEVVVLAGGGLLRPWFDMDVVAEAVDSHRYRGTAMPRLTRSDVADPNLRGAALMAGDR
jgi:glucokinase